ncbi:MAG: GPW/gp25 family protein [Myxococcales bacterium]|nr:GPW/gp25 family protein [Myxococcales bacterium]
MTRSILGRGVRFPFHPGATGGLAYVEGEDLVFQSMKLILATAIGERQMRFRFGSELPDLLFEPITGATLAALEEAARTALRDHEPRVRVLAIDAVPAPDVASRVDLKVEFILLSSSRRENLVFPFYLEQR